MPDSCANAFSPTIALLRGIGWPVICASRRAVGQTFELVDFNSRALSEGGDAQGQATLGVRHNGKELRGRGVSTDIVEAAALAALEIANRIERGTPAASAPTPLAAANGR